MTTYNTVLKTRRTTNHLSRLQGEFKEMMKKREKKQFHNHKIMKDQAKAYDRYKVNAIKSFL